MQRLLKYYNLFFPAVISLFFLAGCVNRTLTVKTTQPAEEFEVFMDGKPAGKTPYTSDFVFYGTREVLLKGRAGDIYIQNITLKMPWYDCFPIDLFSDVLNPGKITNNQEFIVDTASKERPDLEHVRERADAYRDLCRKELGIQEQAE